ncbi:IMFamide precursor [Danaus plexippus plexippus]|uniref:IMFamide n=1 Tax=Danaus plexippus plexippus TaxID=278856 RepID=A0A212FKA6_DANPL|nr:neuropeptide IMFamide [Danaus plexippus plexippus]OWR54173.1 IMFamide precursor [Danaus plexippus plexippus]
MFGVFARLTVAITILAILLCMVGDAKANYKNAPMNGIMFGKRGPTEYDTRGKTFTALCEIATEACQTWFPLPENK